MFTRKRLQSAIATPAVLALMCAAIPFSPMVAPAFAATCSQQNLTVKWADGAKNIKDGKYVSHPGESTTFQARWNVSPDAKAGDTFVLTVPSGLEVVGIPDEFDVPDESGQIVARARWLDDHQLQFTYTDYVTEKQDVWVKYKQQVSWAAKYNGTTKTTSVDDLTFTSSCGGDTTLTGVVEGTTPGTSGAPGKVGDFVYQSIAGYPSDARLGLIRWTVYAGQVNRENRANRWIIEDSAPENQKILCEDEARRIWLAPEIAHRDVSNPSEMEKPFNSVAYNMTCSDNHLRVELTPEVGGVYEKDDVVITFFTQTTDGTRPGEVYKNVATVDGQPYEGFVQRGSFDVIGGGIDGFGSLEVNKVLTGNNKEAAKNYEYTFNVACTDGRSENVSVLGEGRARLDFIKKGSTCTVKEVNAPEVAGVPAKVSYEPTGDSATVTIEDRGVADVTVTNEYETPAPTTSSTPVEPSPTTTTPQPVEPAVTTSSNTPVKPVTSTSVSSTSVKPSSTTTTPKPIEPVVTSTTTKPVVPKVTTTSSKPAKPVTSTSSTPAEPTVTTTSKQVTPTQPVPTVTTTSSTPVEPAPSTTTTPMKPVATTTTVTTTVPCEPGNATTTSTPKSSPTATPTPTGAVVTTTVTVPQQDCTPSTENPTPTETTTTTPAVPTGSDHTSNGSSGESWIPLLALIPALALIPHAGAFSSGLGAVVPMVVRHNEGKPAPESNNTAAAVVKSPPREPGNHKRILAQTGANSAGTLAIGVLAMVMGLMFVLVSRRTRKQR